MFTACGMLVLGLVLLVFGADWLVRGASRVAAAAGVSPLVIGLTIVAFGTSAPELSVSVKSSLSGQADLAVGNVIGSNICNVLGILGLSALVAPLIVDQKLVRVDVPLMIAVSVGMYVCAMDGSVARWEGGLMFGTIVLYTVILIVQSRRETSQSVRDEYDKEYAARPIDRGAKAVLRNIGLLAVGLVLLVSGSNLLVEGAVRIAQFFGVSELVIGLTIVALGTSMPELATSVVAAFKGERDIAVGNVVGSNIFNILSVLGLSALVSPEGVPVSPHAIRFDLPVMIAVAIACLPVFFAGHEIKRWEGALFVFYHIAYTSYLILASKKHDALDSFRDAMVYFVMPLTLIPITVSLVRAFRRGDHHAEA